MEIYNTDSFDFLDKKTRKILLESREAFIPHTPYLYEKKMLEAVRMGDVHLAVERLHLMEHTGKAGTLSKNPLRQAQILMISFITQITRAAMDAGIPENLAYAMSDSYIQTSESCTCVEQIHKLQNRAVRDFSNAVKHQKLSPPYSRAVRKAINYIQSHLQEKITLKDLAAASELSVCRFSHLFREETGRSPMVYVQQEKIDTAKSMLLYNDYSVSEISTILCFSSESHFIKSFKQQNGTTPGKFRRKTTHSYNE